MIEEYLKDQDKRVKKEKLLAWKDFYTQCNNEWLVKRTERQLKKYE